MVYSWKPGSYIRTDANVAGAMCAELSANGGLTAKRLLDANRPEDAPLHSEFEWDDGIAAEKFRETQARHIINCLCIKAEGTEPVRQYFNIVKSEAEYKPLTAILRDPEDKVRLYDQVERELKAIRKKYAAIEAFAKVWEAIDELGG